MVEQKQLVSAEIAARLAALQVPAVYGNGADITLDITFLDTEWSSGQKKIRYEASVFLDESTQTVFMWQRTIEAEAGFSFGLTRESYSQWGKNLYRRVKAQQFGPEGKVYEYDLDLGAIIRAVEEPATKYGWKFSSVMSRSRASYPPGYSPATSRGVLPDQPPPSLPKFCPGCGQSLTGKFCGNCGRSIDTI